MQTLTSHLVCTAVAYIPCSQGLHDLLAVHHNSGCEAFGTGGTADGYPTQFGTVSIVQI